MKIKKEKLDKIIKYCVECNTDGYISECCSANINNRRCETCGKYCKKQACYDCGGAGLEEFTVGIEVDLYVSIYSPDYIKKVFPKFKNNKIYNAKITKIVSEKKVEVKTKNKKLEVFINELDLR